MKFLLILGVVLIHCDIYNEYAFNISQTNVGILLCHYISSVLCSICVPCFFVISGYLFFQDVDIFNVLVYKKKIKSRFATLFIPYVFWNTLCCIFLFIKSRYLGMPGLNVFLDNGSINWINFVKGYFYIEDANGFPYAFAFWFIRNLILFVIISPIARIISKSNVMLVVFYFAYIFLDVYYYGFEWFVLGATLVRFKRNDLPINKYNLLIVSIIFFGMCVIRIWMNNNYIFIFQVLSGFYIIYYMAIFFKDKLKYSELFNYLVLSTFSIYATHQCYCSKVRQFFVHILGEDTFLQPILAYSVSFIILVVLGTFFSLLMKKYFPKTLKLITGSR